MRILKVMGIIIGFLSVFIISFAIFMNWGQKEVANVEIHEVDLSTVDDGTYTGYFDGYRWSNTVAVVVKEHKITSISFTKGMMFRIEEFEKEIINRVIEQQHIKVDVVSGATVSSKATLKAIENALTK